MQIINLLLLVLASPIFNLQALHAFVPQQKQQRVQLRRENKRLDREPYRPSKVPEDEEYDAIVIGSGIGGLTAASLLAQNDKKVLVLEQHYVAGGCCHEFQLKGYPFASGKLNEPAGFLRTQVLIHTHDNRRHYFICRYSLRRGDGRRYVFQTTLQLLDPSR